MRKRNLVMQSAIAMAFGVMAIGAQAGGTLASASGPTGTLIATQNFGAGTSATTEVVPAAVTYTFGTPGGIVINPAGVINVYFRLANGAQFTAVPTVADISGSIVTVLLLTKTSVALSTDKTTIVATFTNGTGANITIGVGGTAIWTPAATRAVSNVNTVLNTAGGTVGVTASTSVLAASVNAAVLPSDVDGPVAASVAASSASAISASVTAPTTETQKIDVSSVPVQTKMTTGVATGSTTVVNLGSFTFTNATTPAMALNGVTPFTVATNGAATGVSAVATGVFGAAAAGGLVLSSAANCGTPLVAGSVATLNVAKTVATWTGGTKQASAAPIYVCMTVDGTTVIPSTQPSIIPTLAMTLATEAPVVGASGLLYNLGLNGASIDVRLYVPAAVTGYSSYIRVINSGTGAAPISVAVIDSTTGAVGSSSVLGTIAASGTTTFTAAQIEAAIGVQSATARPRLRITAPTGNLQVQSFMSSPSGVFSDMGFGQLYNAGGTVPTGN